MIAIQTPYTQFFATDGSPLDNGYLYIGLVSQNPETAPAQVFWDFAGTQPAAQPIRLLNGMPSRDGTPSQLFTPYEHSISVKNARGGIEYYSSVNTDPLGEVPINLAGTGTGQGGKIVGFIQQGAGAAPRTVEAKLRERITVEDFRQPSDTDDVQMFERAVALYFGLGYGGEILAKANIYNFNLRKLVVNGVAITIKLGRHTVINHNTPDFICMDFTGIGCQLDGGRRGGIIGPAVYAPDTGATLPTYAVIRATGDYFEASNFKLLNVRQLGVLTQDIDHCNIHDFDIDCNITDPVIPLVTTFHCGVLINPGSATLEHSLRVHDGFVKTGIQGVFVGNYGTGITARAVLINDMIFSNMWDHGVYSNYTAGMVCVNITANNCHTPIAASGSYNIVKNLTVNNELLPVPINIRNTGSAVSMRDARYCIVDGVTINGYGNTAEPDVIGVDFREFTGVGLVGNLVSNINMRVATGTAQAVRFFTTTPNSGLNRVENIFYEGALAANKGVVDFVGSTAQELNTVDNITGHITGGADGCSLLNFQNQIGSSAANLKMKLNFDAGAAMNLSMVTMVACVETKASELRPYIVTAKGINVGLFGVREFISGARNEAEKIKVPVLEGLASFTPTLAFSSTTKMLVNVQNTFAPPTISCRAGSEYTNLNGGVGTTKYINRIDGNNWFAVA
jgi:hypothetical protein